MATAVVPGLNQTDFYRYSRIEDTMRMGRARGETLFWLQSNVSGIPAKVIQPFTLRIIKLLRGERNTVLTHQLLLLVTGVARALLGVGTIPRVLFMWGVESIQGASARVDDVAKNVIGQDALDYVEWKTGRRTEGIGAAVNGLLTKMVTGPLGGNLGGLLGRLLLERVGFDPMLEQRGLPQPDSYIKWAIRFYLWSGPLQALIRFVLRSMYKYTSEQRALVEMELIERRRLAEEMGKGVEQDILS